MDNSNFNQQSLLPIGTLLQMGKYRIDQYLSSGGFGNTYVITNLQFDEQFAMKEFFMKGINERDDDSTTISVSNKDNHQQFEQQREKFKKEARRLRKLNNPHIVHVHDLFDENGTTYYVMDLIEGLSVSSLIKQKRKPLSENRALDIVHQVLDALAVVHKEGIWHLDLKPGNIMLDKQSNVVVIDFGASKQMSANEGYTSTSTALCYTPGYAPSEQIDQNMQKIGPWTDLYALGATLYNMVTGNQPPSVSEIIDGYAFGFPKSVSDSTQQLIKWMMTPSRQKRPQSVDEVIGYMKRNAKNHPSMLVDEYTLEQTSEDTIMINQGVKEKTNYPSTNTTKEKLKLISELGIKDVIDSKLKLPIIKYLIVFAIVIFIVIFSLNRSCVNKSTDVNKPTVNNSTLENLSTRIEANKLIDSLRHINGVVSKFVSEIGAQPGIAGKYFDSPIGTCVYTGSVDEWHEPNGTGFAEFLDGRFYIGEFIHGTFHGTAYFQYNNGDYFEGTFQNNSFKQGRYRIQKSGDYYEGYFSDGQPSKGQWYDKNGNKIN